MATIYTVEGNTSGGSTLVANGGGVAKKSYPSNYGRIACIWRPQYKSDEALKVVQEALKRENLARNFENERVLRENNLSKDMVALKKTGNGIYALVVGETHSRSNMSAYGYDRETTPWLTKASKDGEIILRIDE